MTDVFKRETDASPVAASIWSARLRTRNRLHDRLRLSLRNEPISMRADAPRSFGRDDGRPDRRPGSCRATERITTSFVLPLRTVRLLLGP